MATEKRNGGLFLSTYGFTENAVESLTEIERQNVRFGQEVSFINKSHFHPQDYNRAYRNEIFNGFLYYMPPAGLTELAIFNNSASGWLRTSHCISNSIVAPVADV